MWRKMVRLIMSRRNRVFCGCGNGSWRFACVLRAFQTVILDDPHA